MKKIKLNKNNILTFSVVTFLIVVFIAGIVWGLNQVLAMEGSFPPADVREIQSVSSVDEALSFIEPYLADLVATKPQTDVSTGTDLDEDSIVSTGSDELLATIKYASDGFVDNISSNITAEDVEFNSDLSSALSLPGFTAADIESYEFKYVYAKCDICGKEYLDDSLLNCTDCNAVFPDYLGKKDQYTLTFKLKMTDEIKNKYFFPRSESQLLEMFDKLDGIVNISSLNADYSDLTVGFTVDRAKNRLKSIRYNKDMFAKLTGTFINDYSAIGNTNLSFNFNEYLNYSFKWAEVTLSEHEMSVEPKGSDNLLATLSCDDPLKYTTKWVSSDDSIVTVDDEGYFKAGKNTGSAVITASFEFNGITYSDSCTVTVKIPVESISVSKRSITLAVGKSITLETKTNPSNATIKTVKWYTENEAIAMVDENGVITAVCPGEVVVYALSDDGYFKSTCEVTVE